MKPYITIYFTGSFEMLPPEKKCFATLEKFRHYRSRALMKNTTVRGKMKQSLLEITIYPSAGTWKLTFQDIFKIMIAINGVLLGLTVTQIRTLYAKSLGMLNKEAASALGVAHSTSNTHLRDAYDRIGIR